MYDYSRTAGERTAMTHEEIMKLATAAEKTLSAARSAHDYAADVLRRTKETLAEAEANYEVVKALIHANKP
jgi:hypothetical protein